MITRKQRLGPPVLAREYSKSASRFHLCACGKVAKKLSHRCGPCESEWHRHGNFDCRFVVAPRNEAVTMVSRSR